MGVSCREHRNITGGDTLFTAIRTYPTFAVGFGTDDTFIDLGTWFDKGSFDNLNVIPEPASIGLLAIGAACLLTFRRRPMFYTEVTSDPWQERTVYHGRMKSWS